MSWVAVLPSIYPPYTEACIESCLLPSSRIVVVDNTENNRGVAASWNIGVSQLYSEDAEWLIIMSAALRFGDSGGCDFVAQLRENGKAWVMEAGNGLGWHLIAFHRRCFDKVGRFDENFFAYLEDLDFSWRLKMAADMEGLDHPPWPKVPCDARLESVAHGKQVAHVEVQFTEQERYFEKKWGNPSGDWDNESAQRWTRPWNKEDLSFWPKPPDPRALPRRWKE